MNCNKQQTIKVTEGNAFTLILPLKKRTYISNVPIDEAIVYADLQDVVLTIGGEQYEVSLGLDGVQTYVPELASGMYDIILTATYHEATIRAAYFEALSIVPWNYASDAQNYLPGSPIVADAAYIIGGPLTDAQLEELKAAYVAAKQAADEAKAEAEAAKEAYDAKAEQLDDVAQQTTLTNGIASILQGLAPLATQTQLNTATQQILTAIGQIDFSALAKQGSNPLATNTAILEAFGNIDFSTLAKEQTLTNGIQSILTALNPKATTADVTAAKQAILDALSHIAPEDPNSKALAEFFGVTLLQGYEFLTDTEVTDELEDIMGSLDNDLNQTVEYPEGSGTYMTKAQAITAQAMQIINPSES